MGGTLPFDFGAKIVLVNLHVGAGVYFGASGDGIGLKYLSELSREAPPSRPQGFAP